MCPKRCWMHCSNRDARISAMPRVQIGPYAALQAVLVTSAVLTGFGTQAIQGNCTTHAFLEVGRQGTINCNLEHIHTVSWYTKEDYDTNDSPLISFSNGKTSGKTDQYNVLMNGSLVIRNVSMDHYGNYVVEVTADVQSQDERRFDVKVEISDTTSPPLPPADPVISGCYHQPDHCKLKRGRTGELSCTVRKSPYHVELQWKSVDTSTVFYGQERVSRPQKNNLFETSITTQYSVANESVMSVIVQCVATKAESGHFLSSATTFLQIVDAGKVDGDVGRSDILSNVLPTAVLSIITIGGVTGLYCRLLQVEKKVQRVQKSIDQVWTVTESGRSIMFDSGQNNSETQEVHTLSDRNEQVSDKGQTVDSDTENNQFPKEAVFQLTDVSHGQASVKMGCSSEEDLVGNMEGKRLLAPQCVTTSQPVAGTVPEGHSNHF